MDPLPLDDMETLSEAIERLELAGYAEALRPLPDGFHEVRSDRIHSPESFIVDEIVRFEGASDPEDEAVLFALRSRDGRIRATFVATYGPSADPVSGMLMQRLDTGHRERDSSGRSPVAVPENR